MASFLLRKMIMHASDKSSGQRRRKVELIFHFVDEAEIPVLAEIMIAEFAFEYRKRRNLYGYTAQSVKKVEVQEALLPLNRRRDYCRSPCSFRVTPPGR